MRAMGQITQVFNRLPNVIISNCAATQQFVKTAYGVDSEIIPCPVDVAKFQKGRKLEQYDDEKLNVVFLGRLVKRKGVKYLIDAVAGLSNSQRSQVRLLIAGTGELSQDLHNQASLSGIEDVEFLGYIKNEDKADILATADIAVFPATGGESFGIVLAEAMAASAGVVIGGDNPGYRSVLGSTPETLINPARISEFTNLLGRLIDDEDERQRLHEIQQASVAQFDINVVGKQIAEIYHNVILN